MVTLLTVLRTAAAAACCFPDDDVPVGGPAELSWGGATSCKLRVASADNEA